jgi:uncharacterized protein YjdB
MKKIAMLLLVLFVGCMNAIAQAPQAIPYQAVARNSSGAILASTNISVRFSIRDSVATGTIKYRETHSVTTTPQGLFTANVGGGTPVTGTFSNINWADNAKFMQVEIDPTGGSSYIDMGTQQMMSVPYALNTGSVKLSVSTTGDTLYTGLGNYMIVPGISAANCTLPIVGSIGGSSDVCVGSTTTLTSTTAGGVWTSSATSTATVGSTGIVTGIAAGTATISYTVTNSCGSTTTSRIISVNNVPSAGAITGLTTVCVGSTTSLFATMAGGSWASSNTSLASVDSTGVVTGISSGTVTISYSVSNTCGTNTATQIVTINTIPSAGSIAGTTSVCVGNTITLSNATTGGSWTSNNTSLATVGSTGVVTGVSAGNVVISYTVANTCGTNFTTRTVTVNGIPSAGSIAGTTSVCVGNTITLSNATTGGSWTSGNTSRATVNSSGLVTGVSAGTVVISYHVSSLCGTNFTTRTVTVNGTPSAGTITGTATVCVGSTTSLSNATTGGSWTSGNTSRATVGSTGVVTGVSAGTVVISYHVSSLCGTNFTTRTVTVNGTPSAGTITGTATVCVGSTTSLSNATTGGSWTSGNTSRATVGSTGVVTGVSAGTVVISYHVSSLCGTNFTTRTVTVNAAPSAGTITGTATVDVGSTTTLSNATTGGTWSSNATGTATVGSTGVVTGAAAGTATISYTVTNSCGSAVAMAVVTVNAGLTIGATYGGGKIAYVFVPGDPGYVAGETHGLIAAPSDQSTGIQWGCFGTLVGGTSTLLNTGSSNTNRISSNCGAGTAARLCADLVLGGYSDWHLPSKDELQKLYDNRSAIGGFTSGNYWSSSEYFTVAGSAWYIVFGTGGTTGANRTSTFYVRAVRAF